MLHVKLHVNAACETHVYAILECYICNYMYMSCEIACEMHVYAILECYM